MPAAPARFLLLALIAAACRDARPPDQPSSRPPAQSSQPAAQPSSRDARIEALRTAGARFWATGNEPGWNLVVWPDSVVLVANYGEDTLLFPLIPADPHPDTTHAAWNIQAGGRTLMLTILRQPCADDMSGEPWTHQVDYLLDTTRLRGCGRALY